MSRNRDALYVTVKQQILATLRSSYKPGQQLPSESSLAERYGTSRATIREALRALEQEGMVVSRHGLGTFATSGVGSFHSSINVLQSCTEMARAQGFDLRTRVIGLSEAEPDDETARTLELAPGETVVRLDRVRYAGDEPLIYSVDVFPRALVGDLAPEERFSSSLMAILQEESKTRIDRSIAAISPVGAECEAWQKMGLPRPVLFLLLEQVHHDDHDRPVLYSLDYYRGDRFRFHVARKRF